MSKLTFQYIYTVAIIIGVNSQDTDPLSLIADYNIDTFAKCSLTDSIPIKVRN